VDLVVHLEAANRCVRDCYTSILSRDDSPEIILSNTVPLQDGQATMSAVWHIDSRSTVAVAVG